MKLKVLDGVIDLVEVADMMGWTPEILQKISQVFLQDHDSMLDTVRDAARRSNSEALIRAAHSLRGVVSSLGANSARESAARIERIGRSGDFSNIDAAVENLNQEIERLIPALIEIRGAEISV